jgi:hypothetical protein
VSFLCRIRQCFGLCHVIFIQQTISHMRKRFTEWGHCVGRMNVWLWETFLDPSDSYFLFADLVGFYTHWTYMHIFRHIFLSNYWWQRSYIWSQASYRYPTSWESFLDPSDSYFLFANFVDFSTHWTYMLIFRRIFLSNYWWQRSDSMILWKISIAISIKHRILATFNIKQDELWANAHLWYPRSLANRK